MEKKSNPLPHLSMVFDFASLYPGTMRSYNIDPDKSIIRKIKIKKIFNL